MAEGDIVISAVLETYVLVGLCLLNLKISAFW